MKSLFSIIFLFVQLSTYAQNRNTIKIDTISTPGVKSEMCKQRIEEYVKPLDGLLEINVNIKKGITRVKYLTDRTDIEEIKAGIATCGFDAGDVLASQTAYKKLPICCKKPEDGGPTTKNKAGCN